MGLDSGVTEAGRIANEAFAGPVGAALDPASPPPRPSAWSSSPGVETLCLSACGRGSTGRHLSSC